MYGSFRPWKDVDENEKKYKLVLSNKVRQNRDNPQEFFKSLLAAFKDMTIKTDDGILTELKYLSNISIDPKLQPEINFIKFPRHYNKTSEFFLYLIKNYTVLTVNGVINELSSHNADYDIQYHAYRFLKVSKNQIEQTANSFPQDKQTSLILNYVRLSLFNIHFEIQNRYIDYLDTELLTIEETINMMDPDFENEKETPNSLAYCLNEYSNTIKQAVISSLSRDSSKPNKKDKIPEFVPRKEDFRPGYRGKLEFDDILKKQQFSRIEEYLYEYEFIDQDYNFTDKHDRKKQLAAIYRLLISKDYFRKKNFKSPRKEFEPSNYRQYLDHRYHVNTSQQFSRITTEDIEKVKFKYFWLNNI